MKSRTVNNTGYDPQLPCWGKSNSFALTCTALLFSNHYTDLSFLSLRQGGGLGGIMLARRNAYCLHAWLLYLAQISLSVRDHTGQPCRCGSWYGWEKYRRCQQNRDGFVEDASLHKQLRRPQWNRISQKAHGGSRKWDHLTGFRQRKKQTFWEWCG